MFAWQEDVPTFNYESADDSAVAAQDPDAVFFEAIGVPMSATVAEMDAAFNDFDADDFLEALVTPPHGISSNKRPINLTCDDAYDEDTTLFQTVRAEMEMELKSLKGSLSD